MGPEEIKKLTHELEVQYGLDKPAPIRYLIWLKDIPDLKESRKLFMHKEKIIATNVKSALALARQLARPQDVILVAGSLFVVGEARKLCINSKG
jgi:ABC-type dipeptide/oligopeptide/nickel transport system permease component